MYPYSAPIYDFLNSFKNYEDEARSVNELIKKYKKCEGNNLLDIGCGTGRHLSFLKNLYTVQGLDSDPNMLSFAKKNFPEIKFHQSSMVDFKLNDKFQIITSLFCAVGYLKSTQQLQQAVENMSSHLEPAGVIVIEPWYTRQNIKLAAVYSNMVDEPDLKVCRVCNARIENKETIVDCHYLLGRPKEVKYFTETHKLRLFTHDEYLEAFKKCGLDVLFFEKGLSPLGFGVYIGTKGTA